MQEIHATFVIMDQFPLHNLIPALGCLHIFRSTGILTLTCESKIIVQREFMIRKISFCGAVGRVAAGHMIGSTIKTVGYVDIKHLSA